MTGSKIIAGSNLKVCHLIIVVVNVLLPICYYIGSGMPYLCIFVEDDFALLGVLTVKGAW